MKSHIMGVFNWKKEEAHAIESTFCYFYSLRLLGACANMCNIFINLITYSWRHDCRKADLVELGQQKQN